ncbi:MAG: hypothetical protein MUE40_11935 [Anaerolineae bacterium]|nr:hypothetical protein [Anaerolineae bacterium]
MKFELYTAKNIKQCVSALNERLQQPESRSRPALVGQADKSGTFALALSSQVAGGFRRTTRLRGHLERDGSVTIVRGSVSEGIPRERVRLVLVAVAAVAFIIILNGQTLLGIFAALIGAGMYIPLVGDHDNSARLLKELRRTLDAKDRPPEG